MSNNNVINNKSSLTMMELFINENENISSLTNVLLNDNLFTNLIDMIDKSGTSDYTDFNDIEMLYFFVHQKKDMNENKNRKENSKKEYFLVIVKQFYI